MNSFLQLYNEDTDKFVELYQDEVRAEVEDRIRTIHFISDVVELFFPRLADTATALLGGDVYDIEDDFYDIPAGTPQVRPPAPGRDGDNDIIR